MNADDALKILIEAEDRREAIPPLTDEWPELDLRTAYEIQDAGVQRRVDAGDPIIGIKLGLTSRAKQIRMNVSSPSTAWLTASMVMPAGVPVPQDELIHPRAEPEIVFVMGERLQGPGVTALSAMRAVSEVYCGVEIIDSRYAEFRFTLPDVVADNASASRFYLGPVGTPPGGLDLSLEACLLEVDGRVVDSATGAAVQGHPGEALALAANDLAQRGLAIEKGWIVLTGGMTDAQHVGPGTTVTASFTHLGRITVAGGAAAS
ncbi:MAG: 2-keto-4-pentenoate hydratase [Acidimicrobiia bacterium]